MSLTIIGDNAVKDVHAGSTVAWPFSISSDASQVSVKFIITTGPDSSDAPEWNVAMNDSTGELWSNYHTKTETKVDATVDMPGNNPKELFIEVICPKGARYGDTVSVSVEASASGETKSMTFEARAVQSIMVLKTQIDQEKSVADSLASKANIGEKDVYAILSPATLRGYVFVEGMNTDRMHEKTRDIKKARAFIDGETSISEIDSYLTPLSTVVGIVEGDIVELVNGPFKGERARVQQIDQAKEEITVELIEAMVPIPVTVKGDSVRVIEKEK
jgi:transcriptional antiterminator NusG